ncbi:MAG: hypothetical protein ACOC45_01055 [Alkalispirochaetaceae bacterium]
MGEGSLTAAQVIRAAGEQGFRIDLTSIEARRDELLSGDAGGAPGPLYYGEFEGEPIYLLPGGGQSAATQRDHGVELLRSLADGARRLTGLGSAALLREYLASRLGPHRRYELTLDGARAGELLLPETDVALRRAGVSEHPADLMAGRALLDESVLEEVSGESWLLVRCERIAFGPPREARRLLGDEVRELTFREQGKGHRLNRDLLARLAEESSRRLARAGVTTAVAGPADSPPGYLFLLFRLSRGQASGSISTLRLLQALPLAPGTTPADFDTTILELLTAHVPLDAEAGLSWLKLNASRRYQYLRPSPGSVYLYRALLDSGGSRVGVQRIFQELRREPRAFRALGFLLQGMPRFHGEPLLAALSPGQRELLLPGSPGRVDIDDRLVRTLDALREIESFAGRNPSTPARPSLELFRRVARERYRRLRRRVEAEVEAGVFSLLFEHARLGALQRAWSRVDRREMVRLLAFEPGKAAERAGTLYSRRGRQMLLEDARALALRAREWEPEEILRIVEARRTLFPLLLGELFDREGCERYAAALEERRGGGGLPAALAAVALLGVEARRPGTVGVETRIAVAAQVASTPALDEESGSLLSSLLDDAKLLRRGGLPFAWLLAHALERIGRPEEARLALEAALRQLKGRREELTPEERRRAAQVARKYQELG